MEFDPQKILDALVEYGPKALAALAILVAGYFGAKILRGLMRRALRKAKMDPALVGFLSTIAYALILTFVAVAALAQLGVNTTSFAAVIAAAGLAIGLALQGSLSNLAAGVMLIANRPFEIGHRIEAADVEGEVEEITIFTTKMRTPDNRIIIVPNSMILDDVIVNHSAGSHRRLGLVIGIGYDDDIQTARDAMLQAMRANSRVLDEPAPAVVVGELGDSAVNLIARPWVNAEEVPAATVELFEELKLALDAAGVSIPFPQRDVHLHQVA